MYAKNLLFFILFLLLLCILINTFFHTYRNSNSYNSTCVMDIALKIIIRSFNRVKLLWAEVWAIMVSLVEYYNLFDQSSLHRCSFTLWDNLQCKVKHFWRFEQNLWQFIWMGSFALHAYGFQSLNCIVYR